MRAPRRVVWLRRAVQAGFLLSSLLAGWQFHRFVVSLAGPSSGGAYPRPAAVEAWPPISSLMSLVHLLKTGVANSVRPAGLVIFWLILVLSLAMRRGFCSWVCPVGTLSEYAHKAGRRVLGRNLLPPRWLDVPLRSVKYLLLGFFLWAIISMSADALARFIHGPYNRIVDVKMYVMFAEITWTTGIVLAALGVLSFGVKNFWCRYLCPYGALLGLCSTVSPLSVHRDAGKCVDCGRCGEACPNRIPVHAKLRVAGPECTACFSCIDACRTDGALQMTASVVNRPVGVVGYALVMVAMFVLTVQAARAAGYWQSDTSLDRYRQLYARISQIGHPRSLP